MLVDLTFVETHALIRLSSPVYSCAGTVWPGGTFVSSFVQGHVGFLEMRLREYLRRLRLRTLQALLQLLLLAFELDDLGGN